MNTLRRTATIAAATFAFALGSSAALAQDAPFGDAESVRYAEQLWSGLKARKLVGPGQVVSKTYTGQHPHGVVLDTIEGMMTMGAHTGPVIIKRNYGGDGATVASVANDPEKYLGAVTVMYRREAGYDPDNGNWFWAKYKPDGSLDTNPKGMQLAGRVAKGADKGCIVCHRAAPGGDMVFNHDRFADN